MYNCACGLPGIITEDGLNKCVVCCSPKGFKAGAILLLERLELARVKAPHIKWVDSKVPVYKKGNDHV